MEKNKIIVFGDLHFGNKNDSIYFQNYQKKIIDKCILPYLQEHKDEIRFLCFLGDIFDKRKQLNLSTIQLAKWFFDQLKDFEIHIIVGNHDCYYRNTNEINSPKLIFDSYKNITVYDYFPVDKDGILFIPWIVEENLDHVLYAIKNSSSKIAMGHLEINGAYLLGDFSEQKCDFGLNHGLFSHFDLVLSGHFHFRQVVGNILYTGCLWELRREDSMQEKGFFEITLDGDKPANVELIKLTDKYKIFTYVFYDEYILKNKESDEKKKTLDLILPMERKDEIVDTFVKVIYKTNKNQFLWMKFLERLNSFNPAEIIFQEELTTKEDVELDMVKVENSNILDIIKDYLGELFKNDQGKQERLASLFHTIYKEVNEEEVVHDSLQEN